MLRILNKGELDMSSTIETLKKLVDLFGPETRVIDVIEWLKIERANKGGDTE